MTPAVAAACESKRLLALEVMAALNYWRKSTDRGLLTCIKEKAQWQDSYSETGSGLMLLWGPLTSEPQARLTLQVGDKRPHLQR